MKHNHLQFHKVVFLNKSLTHFVYEMKHEKNEMRFKNYEMGTKLFFK